MKDYKTLYEATKLDLKDQVNLTERLCVEIDGMKSELSRIKSGDIISLRERVAMLVASQGWFSSTANEMFDWITRQKPTAAEPMVVKSKRGPKKGIKRGPYKKTNGNSVGGKMRDAVKSKRKYTKKSKFWKKKK